MRQGSFGCLIVIASMIAMTGCNQSGASEIPHSAVPGGKMTETRASRVVKKLTDTLRPQFFASPIQLETAKRYVTNFTQGDAAKPVRDAMGADMATSFSFDSSTMARFAHMYENGSIDGFRLYLAKYDNNPVDEQAFDKSSYTVVLVGTKISKTTNLYTDTLVPVIPGARLYLSLDDYSNPCRPICPEAILTSLNH